MSKAKGLRERVMDAIAESHGSVDALPTMREAMNALMDEGLRLIGERNARLFSRLDHSDDDAWWAAMDAGEQWPEDE